MTAQFPPVSCADVGGQGEFARASLPDWPRLMRDSVAAAYLSIGVTQLRLKGPKPKKIGGRTVWDRKDLDRFADALAGQILDDGDAGSHAGSDVERAWRERRKQQGKS